MDIAKGLLYVITLFIVMWGIYARSAYIINDKVLLALNLILLVLTPSLKLLSLSSIDLGIFNIILTLLYLISILGIGKIFTKLGFYYLSPKYSLSVLKEAFPEDKRFDNFTEDDFKTKPNVMMVSYLLILNCLFSILIVGDFLPNSLSVLVGYVIYGLFVTIFAYRYVIKNNLHRIPYVNLAIMANKMSK